MNGKRGAPKGNQYARKHGFYSNVLTEKERLAFENALEIEGVDGEIALLRVKIMSLAENDPDNVMLITKAVNSLERLLRSKRGHGDKNKVKDAVATVLRDVALPLGIGIGSGLGKPG